MALLYLSRFVTQTELFPPVRFLKFSTRALLLSVAFALSVIANTPLLAANPSPTRSLVPKSKLPQNEQEAALELEKPVERKLGGTHKHIYRLTLPDQKYAKIVVQQQSIDVVVRLLDAEKKVLVERDQDSRLQGSESVELVSQAPGTYLVEIRTRYKFFPPGQYQISLVELRTATDKDHALEKARSLEWRARQVFNGGDYSGAIKLATESLRLKETILGADDLDVAQTVFALGLYTRNAGDVPQAERLYLRTLAIREKVLRQEHLDVALVLHNLAYLYHDLGDYQTAEPLYQRALAIKEKTLGKDHPLVGFTLNNLGLGEWKKNDFVKAKNYYQRTLAIMEKASGLESNEVANAMHNLGIVYKESGDYARGDEYYRRALQIWEKLSGKDNPRVAMALESLGILHRDKGDYASAEPLLKRALEIEEKTEGTNHPNVAHTLVVLARLYEAKGDVARAVELQTRANAIEEKSISLNLSLGSERQKLSYFSRWMKEQERRISLHIGSAPDDRAARELAVTTILQRKGRVLDAMADMLVVLRQRLNPQDQRLLDELTNTTAQLERLILGGPRDVTLARHEAEVRALEERREQIESEISRRSYGLYQPSQPVTLNAVRAAIPRDAALIEFVVYRRSNPKIPNERESESYGEARYAAYVIRDRGEVQWTDLGTVEEIDADVNKLRQALRDPRRSDARQRGQTMDAKVMRPVRALLGNATRLFIAPDGELNLVPFAALVDESGRYLVERYSLTYMTSGRDLIRLQAKRETSGPPIVVADPVFGDPPLVVSRATEGRGEVNEPAEIDYSRMFFGPLPGIAAEVRALRGLLPNATFLTKENATETALKRVNAPSILHIATHGFFLQNDPSESDSDMGQTKSATRLGKPWANIANPLLRSGLALAGANRGLGKEDNGLLTAFEASHLNLMGTKLVVLSACDTGAGEVKNGEGVYGLRRALVLAGAESQVMSLWPVSDRSTRELMVGYYEGLLRGQGRGEALRQVQLRMQSSKKYSHPYYWASFIQTGEWANLKGDR